MLADSASVPARPCDLMRLPRRRATAIADASTQRSDCQPKRAHLIGDRPQRTARVMPGDKDSTWLTLRLDNRTFSDETRTVDL